MGFGGKTQEKFLDSWTAPFYFIPDSGNSDTVLHAAMPGTFPFSTATNIQACSRYALHFLSPYSQVSFETYVLGRISLYVFCQLSSTHATMQ